MRIKSSSVPSPNNLKEEGEWLIVVTRLEVRKFVFKITNGNDSFLISTLVCWEGLEIETIENIKKN